MLCAGPYRVLSIALVYMRRNISVKVSLVATVRSLTLTTNSPEPELAPCDRTALTPSGPSRSRSSRFTPYSDTLYGCMFPGGIVAVLRSSSNTVVIGGEALSG